MARRRGERLVPPYVSYKSWETLLHLLGAMRDLPPKLDSDFWSAFHFSGSTTSALKSALLFLNLCTSDYRPTEALQRLAKPTSEEEGRRHLRAIVQEHYGPLLGTVGPERATRQQLKEALARAGLRRETIDKGIVFFVSVAGAAGLTVSEHLALRKTTRRRRPDFAKIIARNDSQAAEGAPVQEAMAAASPRPLRLDLHPAVDGLLHLLASDGQGWTRAERELFLQTFTGAVTLAYAPWAEGSAPRP